ncbi:MAG: DUF4129 domain-containing protein [Sphingomonas sp.]
MGAETGQQAMAAGDFAAAHRALLADPAIQFAMAPVPPRAPPPGWYLRLLRWLGEALAPVGRALRWLSGLMPDAPYARILLWGVLAVAAMLLAWIVVDRIRHGVWRLPRRRRAAPAVPAVEETWAPAAGPVRAWLRDADALAAEGRFAEAVHHLLLRSIEDIGRHRPGAVRPALTARELARAPILPAPVAALFARIAASVERSLFGGAPVDAADWQAARAAYADFALPQGWSA